MDKPIVITISGRAGVGKGLAAELLRDYFEEQECSVLITQFGDLLKYILKTFLNWDGKKDKYGRHLLQMIGTDVFRKSNPDYWVDFTLSILDNLGGAWDVVLIPDTRFPNEISVLRNAGYKTFSILVKGKSTHDRHLSQEQLNHPSETSIDDMVFDCVIENNGTVDDFNNKLISVAKENFANGLQ